VAAVVLAMLVFGPARAAAVTFNGGVTNQVIDGFGANINYRGWNNNELKPVIDALIDLAGMTLFRVIYDLTDWEKANDNADASTFYWTYYNSIYSSAEFGKLWDMMAYLNQRGITNGASFNFMGWGPSWMIQSDATTGSLKPGMEAEWAEMITSLLVYARNTRGLQFNLVAPDNEPDLLAYPEGIHIPTATQYASALRKLALRLDSAGLGDVGLVGPDLSTGGTSYMPQMMADPVIMAKLRHFGAHGYTSGGAASAGVRSYILGSAYPDRTFWMTEFNVWCDSCENGTSGNGSWSYARGTAEYLLAHLLNGASGGLVWEAYDSKYAHGSAYNGVSGTNKWSYWGLLGVDNPNAAVKTYTPRKQFYTHAQISKWVRPGAQRISVTGSASPFSSLLAFKHAGSGQVTIVGINTSGSAATLSGTLASLPAVSHLDLYYTSATANLANGGSVPVNSGAFRATIPADCVFTLTGFIGVSVALTNPVNGARFTAPATIPLAATATTTAGSIALVWFYNGATPLGEATSAPYGFTWNNVPTGNYALTAVAGDTLGNIGTSVVVNVTVVGSLTQIGVTPANPTVAPGGTQQFTATGTYSDGSTQIITSQVTWMFSSPGVATINASGLASGVTPGSTTISATLGSVSGNTGLTVQPLPLAITTTALPSGTVSTLYAATLAASGGIAPYTWSLAGGALPPGLTLGSTGAITGTPTTAGTSNFTVRAADASLPAQTATRLLSLTINSAGTSGLIGNTTEGTLTDTLWYGGAWINAGRFQAGSNMVVATMRAKVGAISGKYKCALYSDVSSRPGRLLGSTAEVSNPASGWQSFPLASTVALTRGSYYWLAIWSNDANARAYYSGNNGTLRWGLYNYGTWPDPISTSGGGSFNYCIYAR